MARPVTRRGLFRAIALRLARPTSDSPLVKRWVRHWCSIHHVNTDYGPCVYCQQHAASLQEKEPLEGAREKARKRTQETPVVQPPSPVPAPMPPSLRDFALHTGPLFVAQRPSWMDTLMDLRADGKPAPRATNPLTQFEEESWINSPAPDPEDTKEAPAIMRLKYCEHQPRQGDSS